MNLPTLHQWTLNQRISFAHTTTVCLGIGLFLLSVAPLFINRMVADIEPDLTDWVLNSSTLMLAITFLTLSVLIRHQRAWAVWSAFIISTMMVASGIALNTILGLHSGSSFVLVLSGLTCYGCWRTIDLMHRAQPQENKSDSPLS